MPSARQDPLSWKNHEENRNEIHVMATVRTYFQFVYEVSGPVLRLSLYGHTDDSYPRCRDLPIQLF